MIALVGLTLAALILLSLYERRHAPRLREPQVCSRELIAPKWPRAARNKPARRKSPWGSGLRKSRLGRLVNPRKDPAKRALTTSSEDQTNPRREVRNTPRVGWQEQKERHRYETAASGTGHISRPTQTRGASH